MKRAILIVIAGIIVVCLVLLLKRPPAREFAEANFSESVEIAALDDALTFARTETDGTMQLLAVTGFSEGQVDAIAIAQLMDASIDDPIDLFNEFGYEAIQERIRAASNDQLLRIATEDLIMPLALTDAHIAAGTNFAAHAEESDVEDGPFLFAKMVSPTVSGTPVSVGDALLDYEVELAFVTLRATPLPEVPEFMGLILSNDFTDRATLLRHINTDDVTSGDGFSTGKSAEGYLPVGNLFVVPRDLRAFVSTIQLRLAVNGELRQDAPMTQAIWDIDELFRQSKAKEGTRWKYRDGEVGLPIEDGAIPARTLVLAGTPDGTAFVGLSNRTMALGVVRMLTGGWGDSIATNVIERYISDARAEGFFLQPGDQVEIQVNGMGSISTPIVE